MTTQTDTDVIYHGLYRQTGGCVILAETPAGEQIGVVPPISRDGRPDGQLSWGYAGAGPATCARSLLAAALGGQAKCEACNGTQIQVWDDEATGPRGYDRDRDGPLAGLDPERWGTCWCEAGLRKLPYQRFKMRFVEHWPRGQDWRMSRSEILAWLAAQPDWGLS